MSQPISPLSLTRNQDADDTNDDENEVVVNEVPLRTKILNVVKACPNYTIRPARLAQELGISVTDASAELCGLLQAVGEGSTFSFEKIDGVQTMVFTFPPNFESKALSSQRTNDWKQTLESVLQVMWKFIKMLTAFGLILSTVIVAIAGMLALIAAMVAMSRGGNHRTRHQLTQQIYNLFVLVRQLLWAYALFGPAGDGDQDPFFREAAYDTSLMLSLCCGNPASLWFWLRASHLRRRRARISRGWGRFAASVDSATSNSASDLEGIRLIRRGSRGEEQVIPVPSAERQGLLSLLIEFLFGPPGSVTPSDSDRWRLRSAVILDQSSNSPTSSVTLVGLSPYVDFPPARGKSAKLMAETLAIVAHFNGVPSSRHPEKADDALDAHFVFPELLAESSTQPMRYDDPSLLQIPQNTSSWWKGFFYQEETSVGTRTTSSNPWKLPPYLFEHPKPFTQLSSRQFFHCTLIAALNWVGVIWFSQSLQVGGSLEQLLRAGIVQGLQATLIPVLQFYAKLFWGVVFLRLTVSLSNLYFCRSRNERRESLGLKAQLEETTSIESTPEAIPKVTSV